MGLDITLYETPRENIGYQMFNFPMPEKSVQVHDIRSCRPMLVFLRTFSVMHGNNPSVYSFNDVNVRYSFGLYEMFSSLLADDESLAAMATYDINSPLMSKPPTFWDVQFFGQPDKMTDSKLFGVEWDKEIMRDLLELLCREYTNAPRISKALFFHISH